MLNRNCLYQLVVFIVFNCLMVKMGLPLTPEEGSNLTDHLLLVFLKGFWMDIKSAGEASVDCYFYNA